MNKQQLSLPHEAKEKHETTTYSFYMVGSVRVIESSTIYHKIKEEVEND
jgi:hypothetical protein